MTSDGFLKIIRCPATGATLNKANRDLVESINQRIAAGSITNQVGCALTTAIDGGLVDAHLTRLYPIIHGIPTLIADEAIDLQKLEPDRIASEL